MMKHFTTQTTLYSVVVVAFIFWVCFLCFGCSCIAVVLFAWLHILKWLIGGCCCWFYGNVWLDDWLVGCHHVDLHRFFLPFFLLFSIVVNLYRKVSPTHTTPNHISTCKLKHIKRHSSTEHQHRSEHINPSLAISGSNTLLVAHQHTETSV